MRVKRALRKHSKNVLNWSKAIMHVSDHRVHRGSVQKIKGPQRTLMELQDLEA
jgi:hypothetical protein